MVYLNEIQKRLTSIGCANRRSAAVGVEEVGVVLASRASLEEIHDSFASLQGLREACKRPHFPFHTSGSFNMQSTSLTLIARAKPQFHQRIIYLFFLQSSIT